MSLTYRFQRGFIRLHERVYERYGRIGHRFALQVRSLVLRTTGRKTGLERSVILVYAPDGDAYLVTASNHAQPHDPAWIHNIEACPEVTIKVKNSEMPAHAEVLRPGADDYARAWELVNRYNQDRYRRYQTRTARPIPVVRLRPRRS
jgi:deazaflavin-dependent oxidoreductase (nitroreductase family)